MTATDTRTATRNTTRSDAGNGTQTADAVTGTPTVAPNPVEAAGPVWGALKANPGASVTTIATAAGVPVPAARRVLNALEAAGDATRTPGGHRDGKRAPDAWQAAPATDTTNTTHETTRESGTDATEEITVASGEATTLAPATGDRNGDAVIDPADAQTTRTAPAEDTSPAHEDEQMDPVSVTEARDALTALGEAITSALSALEAGDRDAALAAAEAFYSASGKGRRLVRAAFHRRPRGASGAVHSAPGHLRAKVAAHLAAHPGKDFTPHEIGKAIGHSAGAIANALDRLAALGQAIETCERPRRFTATDHTTAAATGATAGTATA